jgi:hypothetical protein
MVPSQEWSACGDRHKIGTLVDGIRDTSLLGLKVVFSPSPFFQKDKSICEGVSSLQELTDVVCVCVYVYMQKLDLSNCGLHALPDDICHLSLLEVF